MKYKYSRKELAEKIYKVLITLFESQARQKVELHEIKLELLATQPKPIKEEDKKCTGWCSYCDANIYNNEEHICLKNPKQEESKYIEFEEIEELNLPSLTTTSDKTINSLIRNQKKLYQFIKEKL